MAGRRTVAERAAGRVRVAPRERLSGEWDELYDRVKGVIEDALEARKKVRVSRDCVKCGCKHVEFVEVQDVQASIKAAEFFANQTLGRPGEDRGGGGGGDFVVKRFVVDPEG